MSNEVNLIRPPLAPIPQRQQPYAAPPAGVDLVRFGLAVGFVGGVVIGGFCILVGAYYGDSETAVAGVVLLGSTHYFGQQAGII